MINIMCSKNKLTLTIVGHAGYAEKGKDIICAAVTALAGTLEKSLTEKEYGNCMWIEDVPIFYAEAKGCAQPYFNTIVTGLRMLAEEYPEFINMKEL